MKQRGDKLICVRLDSGDLAYLSNQARIMLDKANLQEIKILASGDLDEYIIHDLKAQGAKIDMFGVGTRMVTGWGEPALTGIYKMCAIKNKAKRWNMKLKITEGGTKATLPGLKQVWRFKNGNNEMLADWIELETKGVDFSKGVWGYHPVLKYEKKFYDNIHSAESMLRCVLKDGQPMYDFPSLHNLRKRVLSNIKMLHPTSRRILNPHIYKVSIGPAIKQATDSLRKTSALCHK
jgi:nicotinate phosphoribosyltransferase